MEIRWDIQEWDLDQEQLYIPRRKEPWNVNYAIFLNFINNLISKWELWEEVWRLIKQCISNEDIQKEVDCIKKRDELFILSKKQWWILWNWIVKSLIIDLMPSDAVRELELLSYVVSIEKSLRNKWVIKKNVLTIYTRRFPSVALRILNRLQKRSDLMWAKNLQFFLSKS